MLSPNIRDAVAWLSWHCWYLLSTQHRALTTCRVYPQPWLGWRRSWVNWHRGRPCRHWRNAGSLRGQATSFTTRASVLAQRGPTASSTFTMIVANVEAWRGLVASSIFTRSFGSVLAWIGRATFFSSSKFVASMLAQRGQATSCTSTMSVASVLAHRGQLTSTKCPIAKQITLPACSCPCRVLQASVRRLPHNTLQKQV